MNKYVAFLRAVNVGGHAIVRMSDLRDAFAAAGCLEVKTFIQSGNVIFAVPDQLAKRVLAEIPVKLRALLGKEPGIMFRTAREMENLVAAAPFQDHEEDPEVKRYVAFLVARPKKKPALPLQSDREALEVLAMKDRDLFILSRRKPNGMFGFPNEFIEKELGVAATSRNWNTVTRITASF
jgi:uncharacterized protein (DUF1697 family)